VTVVLDASAALALLREEPGADTVDEVISAAIMSSSNYTEVISRLIANGVGADDTDTGARQVADTLIALGLALAPLDTDTAAAAGLMSHWSQSYGLSLGDRLCLATAEHLHTSEDPVTVYSSDQAWARIPPEKLTSTITMIR
jgi:PIN domain nuclease of toxin-antitoxin system